MIFIFQPTPNLIWHYCSVKSLFSIVSTKELLLSDSTSLNDFSEGIPHGAKVAQALGDD